MFNRDKRHKETTRQRLDFVVISCHQGHGSMIMACTGRLPNRQADHSWPMSLDGAGGLESREDVAPRHTSPMPSSPNSDLDWGEVSREAQCIKEVVYSLINAKGTSSTQLQLAINSSLTSSCILPFSSSQKSFQVGVTLEQARSKIPIIVVAPLVSLVAYALSMTFDVTKILYQLVPLSCHLPSLLRMQLAKTNFDFVTTAVFSALENQNASDQQKLFAWKSHDAVGDLIFQKYGTLWKKYSFWDPISNVKHFILQLDCSPSSALWQCPAV